MIATQVDISIIRIRIIEFYGFVRELWRNLFTLVAVAVDLDFSGDKTVHSLLPSSLYNRFALQVAPWNRINFANWLLIE